MIAARGSAKGAGAAVSRNAALYQALASCGAALIAFIGFTHEVAGHLIFPWGPAFLGGPIGWHGTGLFAIGAGLLLLGGTLGLFRFPVVAGSVLTAAVGVFFFVATALLHGQFHAFALAGFFAGVGTGHFHRKAAQETRADAAREEATNG
jgi:hypothetical protein